MANRNVQLHKKNDTSELWYPLTNGDCVKLTGYSKGSTAGAIVATDTLNQALSKIENNTASVYTAMGSSDIATVLGGTTLPSGLKVGYVYNVNVGNITIGGGTGERQDFIEYVNDPSIHKTLDKGTNVVIVKHTDNKYYYDVLAMSVAGGGSGTVNSGNMHELARYIGTGTIVSGCNVNGHSVTYDGTTLSVSGDVYATGGVTAQTSSSSDKRLKNNIEPFNAMEMVDKLNPVSFVWNDKAKELSSEFSNGVNYGLIAQDSEGVIDDFVFDMPNGYKGVHYEKLVPILLQAIKELKAEVKELKEQKGK